MIHKPYLLALDLGTASLGHVAFALDEASTELRGILDLGVRVFPDGREPETGEPLAVQRRRLSRPARRDTPGVPPRQNERLTFGHKAAIRFSIHRLSTIGGDFFGGFACFQ